MNKLLEKLIAVTLVLILIGANLATLGIYGVTYALTEEELEEQTSTTNNSKIEFNSYFESGKHIQTENINSTTAKILVNIKVKDAGYLKNAEISFKNTNFNINGEIENSNIQSVDKEKNKILLKQLNKGSDVTIEIPVSMLNEDAVSIDHFAKETITSFTGTYIDANGKEKSVSKEITNKLLWKGTAEATLQAELTKYIPYSIAENKYGVLLQTKINSGIKENVLPVKTTEINIQVPEINGVKPNTVNVIANNTKATNGEENGMNFTTDNYTYNSTNGTLTIKTQNLEDEISWQKNAEDEYLVNYVYESKEIYDYVKTNGISIAPEISAKIEAYNSQETILEKTISTSMNANKEIGTITDFNILATEELSKGQMYANTQTENKKDTNYWVSYVATINSKKLTNSIQFTQQAESDTYNKIIKISEKIFNKILSDSGSIKILDMAQNEIGVINAETKKDSNGNYVLDISSLNNNQLSIITTEPVAEGELVISIEKAIKSELTYKIEEIQALTKITTSVEGKTNNTTSNLEKEIILKETSSVAEIAISKTDLTTVVKNEDVEIRATLDTSSLFNSLYTNPTLKIKLPSYINNVEINSYNMLIDNGLKIKSKPQVITEDGLKVINIELEGAQTEYTLDAEYKGTIIVLNTDITAETLTPTNSNKIVMDYTNNNEITTNKTGSVETELNFVAPTGVVTANGIENYAGQGTNIMSISDESVEATLQTYSKNVVAKVYGKVINNYSNKINNVIILGRIPVKDSLNSTFSTTIKSELTLNGIAEEKYEIYYSNNEVATSEISNESNGWKKEFSSEAKSYLIVTNNYDMESGDMLEFSYDIEIPANLTHNNDAYQTYTVYYNNVSEVGTIEEIKNAPVIKLTTGEGPELEVNISSNLGENAKVSEGQIVLLKATVKNVGKVDATNVKVNIPLPDNTDFMKYVTGVGFFKEDIANKETTIKSLKVGESKIITYYLKMDKLTSKSLTEEQLQNIDNLTQQEIDELVGPSYPQTIVNKAEITADKLSNKISSNEYKLSLQEGKISIKLVSPIESGRVLKQGEEFTFTATVKNISGEESLQNTIVTIKLPENIKYVSATIKNSETQEIVFNESSNTIQLTVGQLNNEKTMQIVAQVVEAKESTLITGTVKANGTEEYTSNILEYVASKVELKVSDLVTTPKYVKEAEEFKYSFKLSNVGESIASNIEIEDVLPEGVEFINATYTYEGKTYTKTGLQDGKLLITIPQLQPETYTDVIITVKANLLPNEDDKEIKNTVTVRVSNTEEITTNTVTNIIEYSEDAHKGNDEEGSGKEENTTKYKVTGTAWLDSNKDGKRNETEELLTGIKVMLTNKDTNKVVTDTDNGQEKITTTNSEGKYELGNLLPGEYLVIFVYDASRYSITDYKKQGVNETLNSDAIDIELTLDGTKTIVGTTDIIKVSNSNVRDIDIGLYTSEKFDLKLEKYVSKITLTTPTIGTKTYTYNNVQTAKTEILARNVGQSNMAIEYKIVITNEGAIPGYAKKIVDYLPKNVGFNTELNKDWYLSENGNVYNASLANEIINPGESKEVTLVVTKKITEDTLGVLNNNAEIYESYNEQGLKDMDSTTANKVSEEDDMSKADVVVSIVTGKIIIYTTIVLAVITLLGFGIYEIKKRVLSKRGL